MASLLPEHCRQRLHLLDTVEPERAHRRIHRGERAMNAHWIESQIGAGRRQSRQPKHRQPGPGRRATSKQSGQAQADPSDHQSGHEVKRQRVAKGKSPTPGRRLDEKEYRSGNRQRAAIGRRWRCLIAITRQRQAVTGADQSLHGQGLETHRHTKRGGDASDDRPGGPPCRRQGTGQGHHRHDDLDVMMIDATRRELAVERDVDQQQWRGEEHRRAASQISRDHQRAAKGGKHPHQRPDDPRRQVRRGGSHEHTKQGHHAGQAAIEQP